MAFSLASFVQALFLHIQSHGPRLCSCALVRDEAGVPVFWLLE